MTSTIPELDTTFLQKNIEEALITKDPSFTTLESRDYSPIHRLIKYQLYDFTPIFLAIEIDYIVYSWEVTTALVLARDTRYQLDDRHTLFLDTGQSFDDQTQMLRHHLNDHAQIIKLLRKDFK